MKSALTVKYAINKIIFSKAAVDKVSEEIGKYSDVETGGVLFGMIKDGVGHVLKSTDAGPKAIRERFDFKCDPDYIDMLIDMEYANSNGTSQYLGEWHSHPQVIPAPSDVDLNSLDEIASSSESLALLVIVGFLGYSKDLFTDQTIAIIKFKKEDNFYALPFELEECQ